MDVHVQVAKDAAEGRAEASVNELRLASAQVTW